MSFHVTVVLAAMACAACDSKGTSSSSPSRSSPVVKSHSGPPPTCDQIAEHMVDVQLAASRIDRYDEAEVAGFRSRIAPRIKAVRDECDQRKWSVAERWCMRDIEPTKDAETSSDAIAACDRAAMLERGEDLGGPPCDRVAEHLVAIGAGSDTAMLTKQCANINRPTKECAMRALDANAFIQCGLEDYEREVGSAIPLPAR